MKIAVVHPYPVGRRGVGGITRLHALVKHLAPAHRVTVLAHASPDPESDAQAVRDLAEIGVAQRLFPLPVPSLRQRLRWAIDPVPYCVGRNRNPALEKALQALEMELGLDVVHVEFAYLAPLLDGIGPGPAQVLAEQETMSLAVERLRQVRGKSLYERYARLERRKVRCFERSTLPRFDRIYGITPVEAGRLAEVVGKPVEVLSHIVCTEAFTPPAEEPREPAVLFVGNFAHRPNLHGLAWFVDRVWPAIAGAVPDARLDVVGPGLEGLPPRRLERPRVRLHGHVEDLPARYRAATVFVNPILSGGGMRGKVLEAFASGRPVVSTPLGMEGIGAKAGTHHLVADGPADFGQAVTTYLRNPDLGKAHGTAARELAVRLYRPAVVFPRLEAGYAAVVAERRSGSRMAS
ncbi:MAG TPA: glycosyltransferase family 4 protein [Thermoanaerobaculia bacterium]|nr:glycosyltransferase family 4 protein [Thermoanaerobaculia bacterium]